MTKRQNLANISEEQFGYAFSTLLKREMDRQGLSKPALAKIAGCSRQALYYFLAGFNRPTGFLFMNIVDALKVDPKEFFEEIKREAKRR